MDLSICYEQSREWFCMRFWHSESFVPSHGPKLTRIVTPREPAVRKLQQDTKLEQSYKGVQ